MPKVDQLRLCQGSCQVADEAYPNRSRGCNSAQYASLDSYPRTLVISLIVIIFYNCCLKQSFQSLMKIRGR